MMQLICIVQETSIFEFPSLHAPKKNPCKSPSQFRKVSALLRIDLSPYLIIFCRCRLPVHCAVEGGKIEIVRWLIEEQFCPITKAVATKNKSSRTVEQPIQTSKGRTVLSIAMSALNVEIIQYLSIEQGVPVFEIKDLIVSLRALEAVLLALPRGSSSDRNIREGNNVLTAARWDEEMYSEREYNECSSLGEDESARFTAECDVSSIVSRTQSEQIATDVCIVCFDRSIDCVITPCGHQICCFQCTSGMKCCPECSSQCRFIKICRS